jgi:hypothetical protein
VGSAQRLETIVITEIDAQRCLECQYPERSGTKEIDLIDLNGAY